jgi:hypothetical protein
MALALVRMQDNHRRAAGDTDSNLYRRGDVVDVHPSGYVLAPGEQACVDSGYWMVIRVPAKTPQQMASAIAETREDHRRDFSLKLLGVGGLRLSLTIPKRADFDAGDVTVSESTWDTFLEARV